MKNVIADSSNLHQVLKIANLTNSHTRDNLIRQLNPVSLIKGYPSYFIVIIDLEELSLDLSIKFPLIFKIFKADLDENAAKNNRDTLTHSFTDYHDRWEIEKLGEINLYISAKNRLPTE